MPQRVIFSFDRIAAWRQGSTTTNRGPEGHRKEDEKMATKKRKEIQDDIMESAHKVWLAGLGAIAMAEKEGGRFFTGLVEQGQKMETKSRQHFEKARGTVAGVKTVAESYWETFGRTIDDQVTGVIHRLGVPTKDEIEALTKKVEALTVAVDKLRTKDAAKPKPAVRKTPAAKKTAPKK
jgi:poly(hydroxyalkanoate) granule-associated protein